MFLSKSNKSPFYQITFEVNGKRTTVSTKATNKEDAYKFLAKFDISNYKKPVKVINGNSILLSTFKDEYLKYAKLRFSKSYVERSIEPAFKFLIDFTGDISLKQLNLKMLDNFISNKFNSTKSGAALYYRTLKAAFNKAVIWNYLTDNPLKKIKVPKVPSAIPLFINEKQLQLVLNNTPRQFLKDIFVVAFYSGLRISEILNLKWSWIDENENTFTTKLSSVYTTKSKRERIIPIHKKINAILFRLKHDQSSSRDFIFTDLDGKKLNENFVSKQFKKSVRSSGLNENLHLHNLRHSFCSNLVQKGVSLYIVKELAGHQNITTTQIYSHLNQSSLSNAVCLL